jgi:quinohemoprotein ethanol dehydrogenase
LPPLAKAEAIPQPPPLRASEADIQAGAQLFADTCSGCHGRQAVGGVKDLRHLDAATHARFKDIVLGGLYTDKGMASFKDVLTEKQAEQIHAYLIARANEDWGQ